MGIDIIYAKGYQVPKLDDKELPVKDVASKIICKNKIKWTPSFKKQKAR
jgi:hypothetical protein